MTPHWSNLNDTPFEPASVTGSPAASADARTSLNSRLFKSGVTTASFTYPPESGLEINRRTGTLVVAKASLWPELPYPLLAYAMRNPTFPNDSTADQWFDDGQYGAYTALGRELGAASVAATEPGIEAGQQELPATETSPKRWQAGLVAAQAALALIPSGLLRRSRPSGR